MLSSLPPSSPIVDPATPEPQRQHAGFSPKGRLVFIMGLVGVAFIFITFGYIAWEQRNRLIQRNDDDIRVNAFFLADHMARLLELVDLTLKQGAAAIDDMSWSEIQASKSVWQQIRAAKEALPFIDNIWLTDPRGDLRLTSRAFPTPVSNSSDREAIRVQSDADQGLFVGEPIIGRLTGAPTFLISRRLESPPGVFRGVVSATVSMNYLRDYWSKVRLPQDSRISLVRMSDKRIIAQYPPPADGLSFAGFDPDVLGEALAAAPQRGMYNFMGVGGERRAAYDQVAEMPLLIQVSIPANAYWSAWIAQARLYGAFALTAFMAVLALTGLASLQYREQAATAALLERQVALRTGELQAETAALEVLNRTGNALAGELDLDRVVQSLVDAGVELSGAQVGAFFYNDGRPMVGESGNDREHYTLYALSGANREAFSGFPALRSTKLFSPTFGQGRTVRLDDVTADEKFGRSGSYGGLPPGHVPVRSYLAVPVLSRTGENYGVLLFGHERPGIFTARVERLVTGLAAQAAIALENGRLYRDAQREIEERKQAQHQQSLLIRELQHRVKNTLATVQAVVGATARSTSNVDEFYKAFVGRIVSLANTHTLLTDAVWQTAPLREILEKELSPYRDETGERVVLVGPHVELPAESAVPIGMAVHELTTNAAKYGALSVSEGRVTVSWASQNRSDGLWLKLEWQERGGPPVSPPTRQGFGSRLLHRVLKTQLDARVNIAYEETGLRVSVETVLKQTTFLDPTA